MKAVCEPFRHAGAGVVSALQPQLVGRHAPKRPVQWVVCGPQAKRGIGARPPFPVIQEDRQAKALARCRQLFKSFLHMSHFMGRSSSFIKHGTLEEPDAEDRLFQLVRNVFAKEWASWHCKLCLHVTIIRKCQEVPSGKGAVSKLRGARPRLVGHAPVILQICRRCHSGLIIRQAVPCCAVHVIAVHHTHCVCTVQETRYYRRRRSRRQWRWQITGFALA